MIESLETRYAPATVTTPVNINTQLAFGGINPTGANNTANGLSGVGSSFAAQSAFMQNFVNLAVDQFFLTLDSATSGREGFVGFQNPATATSTGSLIQAINTNPLTGSAFGNLASLVGQETALSFLASQGSTSLLGSFTTAGLNSTAGFGSLSTLGTTGGFGSLSTLGTTGGFNSLLTVGTTTGSASGFGTSATLGPLGGATGFGSTATPTASIGSTAGFGALPGFFF